MSYNDTEFVREDSNTSQEWTLTNHEPDLNKPKEQINEITPIANTLEPDNQTGLNEIDHDQLLRNLELDFNAIAENTMHPAQENNISTDLVNGKRSGVNYDSSDESQLQSIPEASNLDGEDGRHQSNGQCDFDAIAENIMYPAQESTISTDLVNGHRSDVNYDSHDDSQSQSIPEALNLDGEAGLHQSNGQRDFDAIAENIMYPAQKSTISTDLVNGHRSDVNYDFPDDSQSQSIPEALILDGEDSLHQSYGQRVNETHLDLSSRNVSESLEYEKKQALLHVENIFCNSKRFGFASKDQTHLVRKVFGNQMTCLSPPTNLDNNFDHKSTSRECCKFCGQTQKNQTSLLNHYRWTFEKNVHSKFRCMICGIRFNRQDRFVAHQKKCSSG